MSDAAATLGGTGRGNEAVQLLFYRSLCPMWIYDSVTLAFLAVNDAAIERCGWSREELLRTTAADVCPAEDLPFLRESADISALAGQTKTFSWRHTAKSGELISLTSTRRRIDFEGKLAILVTGANGSQQPVGERAGEAASDTDSASDAIILRDFEHRVLFWNQGAERLYGWSAIEAIGAKAGDLFKNDTEHFALAASELLGHNSWTAEVERRRKDGERVVVKSRWTLIRDGDRRPASILMVETNFTEARKLQWQFLRAQRLEATGALAGGIAHDLNNILAPVLMAVGLLRRATEDSAAQRMLSIIEASAERGARIVKQVFTFARGIDGEHVLLQPKHLLGDLAKIMAQTFPRNIDIQTDFPSELSTMSGDATQIHQLLLNLCVNARDAMPSGGTLTVGAENVQVDEHFAKMNPGARLGPHVLLRVSDTGVGISRETMAKIFDPFVTTKKPGQGSGLGLAAVMKIVKSHGGFVAVHTELGAGTTFKAFLPATKEVAASEQRDDAPVAGGNGQLILVVDDETLIREALVSTLQSNGYRAFTAEDGTDALALYFQRGAEIDVVLTDLSMGQMDGITLIRSLRRLNAGVRVIVSSAQLQKENLAIVSGLGVKRFLHKPYSANQLLRTLQAALADAPKRKE